MGLITALITLPLAPVRGTVWLAERLQEQAEADLYDEGALHASLAELAVMRETGAAEEEEIAAAEDEIVERLLALRGPDEGAFDGG